VTATLSSSDPNENGEGEPLVLVSSGSEALGGVSQYNVSQIFTYTATLANETIVGYIGGRGADSDETCAVSVTINPLPIKAQAQKVASLNSGVCAIAAIGAGGIVYVSGGTLLPTVLGLGFAGCGAFFR
jgi:hypothetical protein